MKSIRIFAIFTLLCASICNAKAEYSFDAGATLNLGAGNNDFAPFYLHSNNFGKITQSKNAQLDIWAVDSLDKNKRFDFAWGMEVLGGYASKVDYMRFHPDNEIAGGGWWGKNPQAPAPIWLQQLYGEVKWRSLFLSVGLKDRGSAFVDQELSSGDMVWSGNSRSIPEVRIGFVDFQDIPLLKKWVQIDACISYGKFIDTKWIDNHFDYYTGKRNPGSFWTYKRLSLRSNPTKPFNFQFGFQMTGIFGGHTMKYDRGIMVSDVDNYGGFKDFLLMILPIDSHNHEGYKTGDHKGSWDIAARYRFKGGETLRAYVQWFWEDGSSLLRENGWDGLWGLEFKFNKRWWISAIVAEYLDLTHMCGPVNYTPGDAGNNGATLPYSALGKDGYYTNFYYRDYVNYGLNMGTPMVMGTLFSTGDNPADPNNGWIKYFRVRGFHLGVKGALGPDCDYIVKYNHRKAWGTTNSYALLYPKESDSFMIGANYRINKIPGLSVGAAFAVDHGGLPSNAVGGMLTLTYERRINIKKK